ncbi:MAG: RDD family protein [Bacilli bacterium]|nr:RDD family protein [Bacilli bacterium]
MKRFDDFYRRVLAYAFDFLLIQLFVSILVDSSVINFQHNDYSKTYKEYENNYEEYYSYKDIEVKDCEDLRTQIENKKIKLDEITTAFSEVSDEDECDKLIETINSKKLSEEEFDKRTNNLFYKLQRFSTFKYVMMVIITYLYLVLFQGFTRGKTLGKKIMRVRVSSKDDKDVTYKQLAIRTLFLGNVIYYSLNAILPWTIDKNVYLLIGNGIYVLNNLFYIVMIVVAYSSKDMIGIHDKIAGTKVIIEERLKK